MEFGDKNDGIVCGEEQNGLATKRLDVRAVDLKRSILRKTKHELWQSSPV